MHWIVSSSKVLWFPPSSSSCLWAVSWNILQFYCWQGEMFLYYRNLWLSPITWIPWDLVWWSLDFFPPVFSKLLVWLIWTQLIPKHEVILFTAIRMHAKKSVFKGTWCNTIIEKFEQHKLTKVIRAARKNGGHLLIQCIFKYARKNT